MLAKNILILILAINISGCATVATGPTFEAVKVPASPKMKYTNCKVTGASIAEGSGYSDRIPVEQSASGETMRNSIATALKENHICENITTPSFDTEEWEQDILPALKNRTPSLGQNDLLIEVFDEKPFHSTNNLMLPYFLYGIVYAASLGFIPMWFPNNLDWYVSVTKTTNPSPKVSEIKNKNSLWMWTPFYLVGAKSFKQASSENPSKLLKGQKNEVLDFILK